MCLSGRGGREWVGEILYSCNTLMKRVLMVIDLQYFSHNSLLYVSFQPLWPEPHSNMKMIFIAFSFKCFKLE